MFSSNNFTNGTLKKIKRDPLTEYRCILTSPMPIFGHPGTSGPELPITLSHMGVHFTTECASQITQKYGINRQYCQPYILSSKSWHPI